MKTYKASGEYNGKSVSVILIEKENGCNCFLHNEKSGKETYMFFLPFDQRNAMINPKMYSAPELMEIACGSIPEYIDRI